MNKFSAFIAATSLISALLLAAPTAANANAEGGGELRASAKDRGVTVDAACVARLKGRGGIELCSYREIDFSVDLGVISADEIPAADLALRAADGTTLGSALAAAEFPVRSKTWTQGKQSVIGLWRTTHTGVTYYDGVRVWGNVLYKGYKGSHTCNVGGWGVGYTITTNSCTRTSGPSTTKVTYTYNFRVSAFTNGFPVWVDGSVVKTLAPSGAES